jgi:hypothetical protein
MSNIQPGTLCILRGCTNPVNEGKIVTVLVRSKKDMSYPNGEIRNEWVWDVDVRLKSWANKGAVSVPENQLIPLTPPDRDEFIINEVVKELCHD